MNRVMASYAPRGLHGRLVQELGAQIVNGNVQPGDRLDVEELERVHGVSRTVVREAIRVLATKGLVDARPKRGTYVLEPEDWNMLDPDVIAWRYSPRPDAGFLKSLHEVRTIIEPAGARLAATRRTKEDLAELHGALDAMEAAIDDVEASIAADVEFHRTLFRATHNEMLQHLEVLLLAGLRARDMLAMHARLDIHLPGHTAVVEAVESKDADAAEKAMRRLLKRAAADEGRAIRKA